jgi:hypothetical protein
MSSKSKDDQIRHLQLEFQRVEKELRDCQKTNSDLQTAASQDKAMISSLEKVRGELMRSKEDQSSQLANDLATKAAEISRLQASLIQQEKKSAASVKELKAETAAVEAREQQLKGEVLQLQAKLEANKDDALLLKKEAAQLQQEELKIELSKAKSDLKAKFEVDQQQIKDSAQATEAKLTEEITKLKATQQNLEQQLKLEKDRASESEKTLVKEKKQWTEERQKMSEVIVELQATGEGVGELNEDYQEVLKNFLGEAMGLLHITEEDLNIEEMGHEPTQMEILKIATDEILRRAQDLYAAFMEKTQEIEKLTEEFEKLAHERAVQGHSDERIDLKEPQNRQIDEMVPLHARNIRETEDKREPHKETGSFIEKADSEEIDEIFVQQIEKLQSQNNLLSNELEMLNAQISTLQSEKNDLESKTEAIKNSSTATINQLNQELLAERQAKAKLEAEAEQQKESLKTAHDELKRLGDSMVKFEDKAASAEQGKARAAKLQVEAQDKYEALKLQREKEETKFIEKLDTKLKDINRLNEENEKLADKLRAEKSKVKKYEESLKQLQEKYETEGRKTGATDPEQPMIDSKGGQAGVAMAEIKETEEYDESDERHHQGLARLQNKIESLQLTNKSLKAKVAAFEKILQPAGSGRDTQQPDLAEMGTEELKERLLEALERNLQVEEYARQAVEHVAQVERECQQRIEQELKAKNLVIAQLKANLEEVEHKNARDLIEKTRAINKMKEELEEKLSSKDREMFYLRKEFESSNVAKEDELINLRRIATEHSKDRLDTNPKQDLKDYYESQPNQESSFNQEDAASQERPKSSNHLEGAKRSTERRDRDIQVWKERCAKLITEIEELKKKRDASLQIDNLTHITSDVHITGPNRTPRSVKPPEDYDSLKQENEYLRQTNNDLRKELERELEVRRQILNEHEYMRTDSDYRITNEDFEAMKQEKVRQGTHSDEGTLYNELLTMYELKCSEPKPATRENIVHLVAAFIDSFKKKDQNKGGKGSSEEIEVLRIDNQQLRKQVESLNTQNSHLKEILGKNKDSANENGSAQKQSQLLANKSVEIESQVLDALNQFLKDMELQPLDKLEISKLKQLLNSILRLKRKLLVELKAKDELIEELKLSSLKASSERGEGGGTQGTLSQQEEYQRQKDLLQKFHNLRRKYESCLAEVDQLQIDKENLTFEIEDLRKTNELENKRREALEIQLNIIKQEATSGTEDMKEHIKKLFGELFKAFTESVDQYQASQILEYLTSMIGYSADERKALFENLKKKKFFEKVLKKK